MKLSELKVNEEYAVLPSWTYNGKQARDLDKVRENDVIKATLISTDKYVYDVSSRYQDVTRFRLAQQGDRSVGVIVKATDNNGTEFYWTARLADILKEWSLISPQWEVRKLKEAEERKQREIQEQIEREYKQKVYAYVERSNQTVPASITELVGKRCGHINVTTSGYGMDVRAVAEINLADLETLIELAYQGREAVA
jgi:hypothetical protein